MPLSARGLLHERRRWIALIVVCFAMLMNTLDQTIVNVALPTIQHDLHFSQAALAWVIDAYLITFAGALLLAGRLGDLIGRKKVFLVGVGLFTISSAACGAANSQALLVGARFAQGLGAALSSSVILAIIVADFPIPRERAKAMSSYIIVAVGGGSLGLLVGGYVTQALSWHWIFFINIPIGLITFLLGIALIDENTGLGIRAGVDIGGNYGTPNSISTTVSQPPDYVLFLNYTSSLNGTLSNAVKFGNSLTMLVDTSKTIATHFTSNSWASPQAQVTAGYPLWIEPSVGTAYYEEVIDYGATLAACRVTVNAVTAVLAGSATLTPKISVSNTSATGPWTDYAGVSQAYVTAFRWVKIRFDVVGTGTTSLVSLSNLVINLDAKGKTDQGTATAVSTDTGGTVVNFNASFVAVNAITVTPQGTGARYAIYDFAGGANPTSFKVLLYDSAGNRLSGTVSWTARGY